MLVFGRRIGQETVVRDPASGEEIVILVVDIRSSGEVRLGIKAPKHLTIHRREIQNEVDAATRRAHPDRSIEIEGAPGIAHADPSGSHEEIAKAINRASQIIFENTVKPQQ